MCTMVITNRLRLATATIVVCVACFYRSADAENAAPNPTAEQVAADGKPVGWGLYVGAGQMKLTSATDQRRSGQRSACLELTDWHTPAGADAAAHRSVSGAIVLAPNDGYKASGAIACSPGTSYAFSFWYKGNVSSATVGAVGWPSGEADHTKRIPIPILEGDISPGSQWRQRTGRFRIPEGVRRFVLMVNGGGDQSKGFTLGKLYVDDAEIIPHMYPNGELRAIWCALPNGTRRDEALREINASLDKVKAGGFNTVFVWTLSRYLAALDRPDLQKIEPQAAWDVLGEVIRAAKARGIQVHMWYSPWIYKREGAIELREHPEWAAVDAKGVADPDGVCFIRPEVRQFELELLAKVIDRYPDLAGIHIEEPGFNWGESCCCDYCREFCLKTLGVDLRKDPQAAKPVISSLPAFMCTNFFIRLRQMMLSKRPEMWLSANGGGENADWHLGRDWPTWARRGYIDFYVPQLYTGSIESFTKDGLITKSLLGECDLVTGMAVSWSGIHPALQSPAVIKAEIAAARKLGAKGFAVYHQCFFKDAHYQAVREAVQEQSGAGSSK
jgi:hypothetical protein